MFPLVQACFLWFLWFKGSPDNWVGLLSLHTEGYDHCVRKDDFRKRKLLKKKDKVKKKVNKESSKEDKTRYQNTDRGFSRR